MKATPSKGEAMEVESAGKFQCESCGRSYRWKPDLAGRKVKCACGQVIIAPLVSSRDDDLYDLAADEPPVAKPVKAPAIPKAIEYQQPGTPGNSLTERYFPDPVRDLYGPLGLIGGGLILRFGYVALFWTPSRPGDNITNRLARDGLFLLCATGVMLLGVLIVGKFRKINFGPLPVAIMKLSAVAVAPSAVSILFGPLLGCIPFGRLIVEFGIFFGVLGALFDLDQDDTWFCCIVMFLLGLGAELAMIWINWK